MNELSKRIERFLKNPKLLVAVGIIGIMLVFISSFFGNDSEESTAYEIEYSPESYCADLEQRVGNLVEHITGDKNATVVITVDSGKNFEYADTTEYTASNTDTQKSESSNKSYITVRTADGGEQALVVRETMPKVRGIAIVCRGGDDEIISKSIENAVTAALDITSKRVYIAGGKEQ